MDRHLPPGLLVLMTPKGSMNIITFCTWIEHVAKYKPPGKCFRIFDGAKCHLDHTIVEVAERHDIVLFCVPSNTTHELQPMDKSVFRSFEHHWDDQSLTPANIKARFAATGIFPFNPEAIPVAFAPSVVIQVEEQPREESIVKPTINERLASPTTAEPSNIRQRPAFPKAGPSNIRKLKITTENYSSDSTDDNSEESIPFLDDSDDDNEYQSNEPLNKSIKEITASKRTFPP
ncbi:hypothetical protein NQ314_016411 [Rhamnusium bicolor]|uniref:DDE-1 domain-containing protein n=1 Tax=Rhamnusium bicolor TaxID=1586634 RepID=A0AAV8WX18_9CUCU|nr:hypothetical protein NQ314_016411 [Rhamnusium bicolor]